MKPRRAIDVRLTLEEIDALLEIVSRDVRRVGMVGIHAIDKPGSNAHSVLVKARKRAEGK